MRRGIFSATLAACLAIAAAHPAGADERAAAAYNARVGGVSLVVMRNGAVVMEDYPNGGAAKKAWNLASGTKSFAGILAAAAVQDGFLRLDELASDTLVEWRRDPRKAKISIRQILNLTSGVDPTPIGRAPTYAAAIAEPMRDEPGAVFEYGPVNFQIFGEIIRRKLKTFEGGRYADPLAYLEARILAPVGISYAAWKRGRDGMPTLPQGAELTARDWARLGEFVRRGGVWNGRQLVDAAALADCFKGSSANPGYGLTWWLRAEPGAATLRASRAMTVASDLYTHPRRGELPPDLVMAAGAGGQRLYVIPSRNLVVVRHYPRLVEFRRARRSGARDFSDVEFLLALLAD